VARAQINEGWIKVFRKIRKSVLWKKKPFSPGQAWIDMLLRANHDTRSVILGWKKIEIHRGEFITSQRALGEAWGWGRMRVRLFLNMLEKEPSISTTPITHTATHVKIIKYDTYQGEQPTEKPTEKPTSQPTRNPRVTTNKNNKNIKKKRKKNIPPILCLCEYVQMKDEELQTLLSKFGERNTLKMIDKLDNYKGASGKKYKSDYRAILSWVADEIMSKETQDDAERRRFREIVRNPTK